MIYCRPALLMWACCGEPSEDSDIRRENCYLCAFCFCILCPIEICLYAYKLCNDWRYDHTQAKCHRNSMIRASVPALPKRRRRELSPPPSERRSSRNPLIPMQPMRYGLGHRERTMEDQMSSLIFKLSPEMRQMVYREVLGDHDIAIVRMERHRGPDGKYKVQPGRLGHLKYKKGIGQHGCIKKPTWLGKYLGRAGIRPDPLNPEFESYMRGGELLSLLKSCRRIYSEAMDLLYSSNTFHFCHPKDLLALSSAILPQRMNSITSIHLHFFPFYDTGLPEPRLSAVVGAMKHLKQLEISHTQNLPERYWSNFYNQSEDYLIAALREFRRDIPITLSLTLATDRLQALVESAKFTNVRVVRLDISREEA
ncbi:hypothetical protein AJ79_02705 [Helicocarpus griseus UAMH5409]|uniref:DUF7730 domain-containing protein n=1 Tax=Helicocarpus griseus UAMH5409 TaxID=1447875 RepID=A0A2B7Y1U7_9EURO|nr:hypothetical protein AJ79_02705 [Helicocarpus griseus UAMH5409]